MSTWMITGSSSGLGRALAEAVLEAGHNAVLTARNPDAVEDLVDAQLGQARRRPDRPADPAPGAALGARQDLEGVPGAGDADGRPQGPRDARQQLHGRPPHHAAGQRDRRALPERLRRQPDEDPDQLRTLSSVGASRTVRRPGASGSRAPVQPPVRYAPAGLFRQLSRRRPSACGAAGSSGLR